MELPLISETPKRGRGAAYAAAAGKSTEEIAGRLPFFRRWDRYRTRAAPQLVAVHLDRTCQLMGDP